MKSQHKSIGPSKEVEKEIIAKSAKDKKSLFTFKKKDKKNGKR